MKTLVTATGVEIEFSKVKHQHWSNIFWYNTVFQRLPGMPVDRMKRNVQIATDEIVRRFDTIEPLPWKPVYEFELEWLENMGNGVDVIVGLIIVDGITVGDTSKIKS